LVAAFVGALAWSSALPTVAATSDTVPPADTLPGERTVYDIPPVNPQNAGVGSAIAVPPGCAVPTPATAVFEGEAELIRGEFVRFRVERVLAGSLDQVAVGGRVDLAYGVDARFLEEGVVYLIGTAPRAEDGRLTSSVRPPQPVFGGDAIIGANDSDVDCPVLDDPVRTLFPDGSSVDSGLFTPLRGQGPSLLNALVTPLLVASLVLVIVVALKHVVWAMFRSLRPAGVDGEPRRRARAGRRRHRSDDESLTERLA
jgi:hypothetical protein